MNIFLLLTHDAANFNFHLHLESVAATIKSAAFAASCVRDAPRENHDAIHLERIAATIESGVRHPRKKERKKESELQPLVESVADICVAVCCNTIPTHDTANFNLHLNLESVAAMIKSVAALCGCVCVYLCVCGVFVCVCVYVCMCLFVRVREREGERVSE